MTQTGSAADDLTTANPTTTGSTTDTPLTRRAIRQAETAASRSAAGRAALRRTTTAPATTGADTTAARPAALRRASSGAVTRSHAAGAAPRAKQSAPSRKRKFLAPVVLTVAAGMFGTMAVPAAFATTQQADTSVGSAQVHTAATQQFDVSDAAAIADTSRDSYSATSQASLDAAAQAKQTAEHAQQIAAARAATAKQYASYTGPSAAQYAATASAANTPFSLPAVVATAKQYIGTPYVFGGADPSGFDCSGYVMFVYAQYGIQLAHSVPLQDQAGTTIPESEAQPGDVVIFNNEAHDGFYMGNGMIMDAPKPGGSVSIRPIWTSDYHIVRFGI